VATLQRLQTLGQQGATIIFDEAMPHLPMGYNDFPNHASVFDRLKIAMEADKKHFTITRNLVGDLLKHGALQETIASGNGLSFIRKKQNGRTVYFISNLSNKFSEGWVNLGISNGKVLGYDPLTGKKFSFAKKGKKIYLSLPPGQSCFVMEQSTATPTTPEPKKYDSYAVNAKWEVQFLGGRPDYHKTFKIDTLQSWTSLSDTAAFYTGTAKYTGIINIPAKVSGKKDLVIDLGTVNESATVKINGKAIGTAWAIPFRLTIPKNVVKAGQNTLEIAVTNLSANYMRVYDKEHPEWKKFYDANIVDITYQPFNASKWPVMPSGLSTNNVKILYR
jgi:hypothetical protein